MSDQAPDEANAAKPDAALPPPLPAGDGKPRKIYTVGTLKYTMSGLVILFIWLLWGDFVFILLDVDLPLIFPKQLRAMGANDTTIAVLLKSIPQLMIFLLSPVISFRSDRYRSRWGRRIPYLLWTTPLVGLAMVLIGCHEGVTSAFMGHAQTLVLFGHELSRATVALGVFGILLVGFSFVNTYVNTIYWYLFNDVVPRELMTRFMSIFRIVMFAAGMLYSKFILAYSLEYFRTVFVIGGIAYVVGFMLMCLFVKEGQYPPPAPLEGGRKGKLASAKTYFKECFTHRFYWFYFLSSAFAALSWQSSGPFRLLRDTDALGLELQEVGDVGFWAGLVTIALLFPMGWLADKLNPVRVYIVAMFGVLLALAGQSVWAFYDFGHAGNLTYYYVITLAAIPIYGLTGLLQNPVSMRLLPKERYGQFMSANAMLSALAGISGSLMVGIFFDFIKNYCEDKTWPYRFYPVWTLAFQIPSLFFLYLVYRYWKTHGGDKGFVPPGT